MDTSLARRNILARIRAAQGREPEPSAAEREAAADYLARHPPARVRRCRPISTARFIEEAQKMATTVDSVESLSDVPAAAHRYLTAARVAVTSHRLANAARSALGGSRPHRRISQAARRRRSRSHRLLLRDCGNRHARVAVRARKLMRRPALLPETHIAIVPASRIVSGHEDAFALIRSERGELPRAVNFVSGPSRPATSNRPSCSARMGLIGCM